MITIGVDLAAEPDHTALARLKWSDRGARITSLRVNVDDDEIVMATRDADKVGLDCPIGWPDAFVDFVVAHRDGQLPAPEAATPGKIWRHPLANRHTDDVTRERSGLVPLSVSADRIARPAMRAAGLLARLAAEGRAVDRSGRGVVVEVYPAASLKQWGLPHRRYKGPSNAAELHALVDQLLLQADWLDPADHQPLLTSSDHAFDAVIAGLTARAAALGLTRQPTTEEAAIARREGWIALPTTSLPKLQTG
jgi:predicted nuclease with RNAse H fold